MLSNQREATEVEVKEQHCATTAYLKASTAWSGLKGYPWLKQLRTQKSLSFFVASTIAYSNFAKTHQLTWFAYLAVEAIPDTLLSFCICVTMCMFDTVMTWHISSTRSKADLHAQEFPHLRDLQRLTGQMIGMIKQKATVMIGWPYQNSTRCPATVSRSSHLWSMCFFCWLASLRITSA